MKIKENSVKVDDTCKLKAVSHELGYEVKKIFDSNFDEVNIYHRVVFEAVYGR